MKFLRPTTLAWLLAVHHVVSMLALVKGTEYDPFPDCTNDSTACKDNRKYPYCVQCYPGLALCSASPNGCGCAIPQEQLRHDNTGAYLDHLEVYMTRPHCVTDGSGTSPDRRARNISQCNNTRLVVLRGTSAACPQPNTTCMDVDDTGPGWRGGPTCVAGTSGGGSIGVIRLGRAVASMVVIVTFALVY
jgi:hypothetical protein